MVVTDEDVVPYRYVKKEDRNQQEEMKSFMGVKVLGKGLGNRRVEG